MPRPDEGLLVSQKYIFYFLFLLKFPCMNRDTPKPFVYLWETLSWISVFLPLHMVICVLKTVHDKFRTEDIITLTSIGVEAAWFSFSFLCMMYYKVSEKELVELMNKIEEHFKWRSPRGKTYVDMETIYIVAKYVSIFWQLAPTSVVVASVIAPFFQRPLKLPAPSWYPINQNNPYQFVLAYFLQSWTKLVMVSTFASGSSFYLSFSLLCCGQFNILRCGLKNLIYTSGVYKRFPETQDKTIQQGGHDVAEYLFAQEVEEILPPIPEATKTAMQLLNTHALTPHEIRCFQDALRTCIQHHEAILNVLRMVLEFLNTFAFLRVVEMTLQMCFLAFMYVKTSSMLTLLFMLLTYVDLFFITYPTELIQWQSGQVGVSLMLGPWYLVAEYFRNDFVIILRHAMYPINFTAGKIMKLNTDRFRTVVTTAFSYYTLLSSFDEE